MCLPTQPKPKWIRKKPIQISLAVVVAVIFVLVILYLAGVPLTSGTLKFLFEGILFLSQNVTATISAWSYTGVFILMLLEATSLPIPSEAILPFVGYLVLRGELHFLLSIATATLGGLVGSLIAYYIGLKAVHVLSNHGILGKVFVTQNQLNTASNWFNKYGAIVVFFGRLIPGLRTIVSFPAGAVKMPLLKFTVYTTVGSLLWNALLIYAGYWLGAQWQEITNLSQYGIVAVAAVLAGSIGAFLIWRHQRKKASPTTQHSG